MTTLAEKIYALTEVQNDAFGSQHEPAYLLPHLIEVTDRNLIVDGQVFPFHTAHPDYAPEIRVLSEGVNEKRHVELAYVQVTLVADKAKDLRDDLSTDLAAVNAEVDVSELPKHLGGPALEAAVDPQLELDFETGEVSPA